MVTDGGIGLVLMIGLILAYAAAITSLGLAVATWVPRLGRVITVNVMTYMLVAVGWPLLLQIVPSLPASQAILPFNGERDLHGLCLASPFFGIYATTEWVSRPWFSSSNYSMRGFGHPWAHGDLFWPLIWIGVYSALAVILAFATLQTFDRCMGRVPVSRRLYRWGRDNRPRAIKANPRKQGSPRPVQNFQ
jgi:hypothetical protein